MDCRRCPSLCFSRALPLLRQVSLVKSGQCAHSSEQRVCIIHATPHSSGFGNCVHRSKVPLNSIYRCAKDLSQFVPGTTTLLLQVPANAARLTGWTQEWLREYIFSSQGTLPIPVSQDNNEEEVRMLFYAADLEVRGILTIRIEPEGLNSAKLRVTSSSRFINEAGTYTSTLPGERRIVRDLFSGVRESFKRAEVLYKPRYIRLRKQMLSKSNASVHVTILVCEVRNATRTQMVAFLHNWAFETQFGAGGLSLANVNLPPISSFSFTNGIKVRTRESLSSEIIVHVRIRGSQSGPPDQELNQLRSRSPPRTIVVVSATYPENAGSKAVVKRYNCSNCFCTKSESLKVANWFTASVSH